MPIEDWIKDIWDRINYRTKHIHHSAILMRDLKKGGYLLTVEQKKQLDGLLWRLEYDSIEVSPAEQLSGGEILTQLKEILGGSQR